MEVQAADLIQDAFCFLSLADRLPNGGPRSTTLPRTSITGEERLIKFSGIGPVDETGMPIASRSVSSILVYIIEVKSAVYHAIQCPSPISFITTKYVVNNTLGGTLLSENSQHRGDVMRPDTKQSYWHRCCKNVLKRFFPHIPQQLINSWLHVSRMLYVMKHLSAISNSLTSPFFFSLS